MFGLTANNLPRALAALVALSCVACSTTRQSAMQPHVSVAPSQPMPWPTPLVAAPEDPPRILRTWMSSMSIDPGTWFDGAVTTSTNVASVEVRTAAFSINTTHVAPGRFRFHARILELPPLSRRHRYALQIIARNTRGDEHVDSAVVEIK